jgi:hypothetical protein
MTLERLQLRSRAGVPEPQERGQRVRSVQKAATDSCRSHRLIQTDGGNIGPLLSSSGERAFPSSLEYTSSALRVMLSLIQNLQQTKA